MAVASLVLLLASKYQSNHLDLSRHYHLIAFQLENNNNNYTSLSCSFGPFSKIMMKRTTMMIKLKKMVIFFFVS